jgi:hypothetical protein
MALATRAGVLRAPVLSVLIGMALAGGGALPFSDRPRPPPELRQRVVQPGDPGADLFLWVHMDAEVIRERVAAITSDAVATELWGEGTDAYRALLPSYQGLDGWVRGLAIRAGRSGFRRTCLTTWSAGSQVIKDVCQGASWPDAIVSLDGLYGQKPPGARPGDGQVLWDEGLDGVTRYALAAARGERILVLLHSSIETPYASSREVAEEIRRRVEGALGVCMGAIGDLAPGHLGGHEFEAARSLGQLYIVSFAGKDEAEHLAQAQLYDEAWLRWIPWVRDQGP